ncbi:hypothetical protein HDU98_008123 [Podochytrium sp. JEL0797]|nr:hypothetical protein HDU98_008123 [Podochytrium sp. JEL0797]
MSRNPHLTISTGTTPRNKVTPDPSDSTQDPTPPLHKITLHPLRKRAQEFQSLISHFQRVLSACSQKYKKLRKVDDAWTRWSSTWFHDNEALVTRWVQLQQVDPKREAESPLNSPFAEEEPLHSAKARKPKSLRLKSREEILKQHISRLENARISYIVMGEVMPQHLADALARFGTRLPPRWLSDKEKSELVKYETLLENSESALKTNEYRQLVAILFDMSTNGFDKHKFEQWVVSVSVPAVFSTLGALVTELPFVPCSVGSLISSLGTAFTQEQAILPAFHAILKESTTFLLLLMNVEKSIAEAERHAREQQLRHHSTTKLQSTATEDMRQILDSAIDVYEAKIRDVHGTMKKWAEVNGVVKFVRQVTGAVPNLGNMVKELEEIRMGVRDDVLMHVGSLSGKTLDAVHDGFKTIENLEASILKLEADKIELTILKKALEAEKEELDKDMFMSQVEMKRLESDKVRLNSDKKVLEADKVKLTEEKKMIYADLKGLIERRDSYAKLNTLHREIGSLAISIRSALLAAGDRSMGLSGHLVHGAVVFNVAKSHVAEAIGKIQELHDLSVRLKIPFEPSLFEHFNFRVPVHNVKLRYRDYVSVYWSLSFSPDLEWLYGVNGTEVWVPPIAVEGLRLENSCFPAKYDPN